MIHPASKIQYIDDNIGYGVFATAFIPLGTITWVHDPLDRELTPEEFQVLPPSIKETALRYTYRNNRGNYILPWDHTRYTNHSFFPNTMLTPYGFEIAIKDIHQNEQITNDYGTLNIIESFEPANEGHSRTMVHPDDITRYREQYDEMIHLSLFQIVKQVQPLWDLVPILTRETINRIIQQKEEPLSILHCYCQS